MRSILKSLIARNVSTGTPVPPAVAQNMIQGYKNNRNYNGSDTIYADFSFSKFRAFMGLFGDASGIRIYNAMTATNQHCFLFVPIKNVAPANQPPCYVEMDPEGVDLDGDGIDDIEVAAFNFGTLCPPGNGCNCDCDGVGTNRTSFARLVYGNLICTPPEPAQ